MNRIQSMNINLLDHFFINNDADFLLIVSFAGLNSLLPSNAAAWCCMWAKLPTLIILKPPNNNKDFNRIHVRSASAKAFLHWFSDSVSTLNRVGRFAVTSIRRFIDTLLRRLLNWRYVDWLASWFTLFCKRGHDIGNIFTVTCAVYCCDSIMAFKK